MIKSFFNKLKLPIFAKLFFSINLIIFLFTILLYFLFIYLVEREFNFFLLEDVDQKKRFFIDDIQKIIIDFDNEWVQELLKDKFIYSDIKKSELLKKRIIEINKIVHNYSFIYFLNIFLNRNQIYFYIKSDSFDLPPPFSTPEQIQQNFNLNENKENISKRRKFFSKIRDLIKDLLIFNNPNPLVPKKPPRLKKGFIFENFTLRFNNRIYVINYIIYNEKGSKFLNNLKLYFLYIYLILSLISIPFIYLLSKNFSKTIRNIVKETIKLSSGDYNIKLDEKRNDELGLLIDEFNKLSIKLKNDKEYLLSIVRSVTHDISTPLNIIKSYIYGIYDGVVKVDAKTLNDIDSEIERINDLINEINEYFNLNQSNKKDKLINIVLEISIYVEKFINLYKDGVSIEMEKSEEFFYNISRNNLRSLIENLLKNSIKHNNKKNKIIRVNISNIKYLFNEFDNDLLIKIPLEYNLNNIKIKDLKNYYEFESTFNLNYKLENYSFFIVISDNGNGFDKEKLDLIFNEEIKDLQKLSNVQFNTYGLEIVKKICKIYKIGLKVYTKKDIGTTIILFFK